MSDIVTPAPGRSAGRRALLTGAAALLPVLSAAALLPVVGARRAFGQGSGLNPAGPSPAGPIKIGVLCDMSGPYADATGPGLSLGVQMAVEAFGGTVLGRPITVLTADDQNKPDVGAGIGRRWLDQDQVDTIVEGSASSIALAVAEMTRARNRVLLIAASTSTELTGRFCSPTSFQFGIDTYAGPKAVVSAAIKKGLKTWFILNVDYAFGHSLKLEATRFIEQGGGRLLGSTAFPLGTADVSSAVLEAQASGAQAIALACGGTDWTNVVKQSHEFGLVRTGQTLVTFLAGLHEVRSVGVATTAGMILAQSFYWDLDDGTRAFTAKFRPRHKGMPPNWQQASGYSATLHYLKAMQAAGTAEGLAVAQAMRAMPVDDFAVHAAPIRGDGQVMRPMYLAQVKPVTKTPMEDDVFDIVETLPAERIWRPSAESACALLRPT